MGESTKGCLIYGIVLVLGILGLVFIKEILIGWWIFLALAFVVAIIIAITSRQTFLFEKWQAEYGKH